MKGVAELRQALIEARSRRIDLGGIFHVERFMGALVVEFMNEGIERGLLLQAVHACGAGCLLFQSQVHALVAAVLLRLSGLDAFDCDTETQPPH